MKINTLLYWIIRGVAALILLQTLYFKFSASEESVFIFTTVGMEPWGRISVGILELVAAVLLLINATAWIGAGLSAALMAGTLFMHVTMLGIEVKGDGGYLFILAIVVLVCSVAVLWMNKQRLFRLLK